ncbi:MAG: hypothetical protein NTY43_10015 [Bacteroidetes bacterium]|nr:hypothetical protein [Bacteroidota bacterium]
MKTFKFYTTRFITLIAMFVIMMSIFSCAKQEVVSDLDFQKNLLAGSGSYQNTKHTWRIDSLTQNGTVLKLNTAQKKYTKTFNRDGSYTDSDGVIGTWLMPTIKDLTINSKNGITNISITNKYQLIDINSAQLHLKYDSANVKQDLYFVIFN